MPFSVPETPVHVERVSTGWPSGPVPWMLRGEGGRAWVWDPNSGFLRVPGHGKKDPSKYLFSDGLSDDGRSIEFQQRIGPGGSHRRVVDLITGETRTVPELLGKTLAYPIGDGGRVLVDQRYGDWLTGRVSLERDGQVTPLSIRGRVGPCTGGRQIQFSPSKKQMAFTVGGIAPDQGRRLVVARVEDGEVLFHLDHAGILTSSTWSPDGRRLLVLWSAEVEHVLLPHVLDLDTGVRTSLAPLFPGWRLSWVAGWIDDDRILVAGIRRNGRIMLSATDIRAGTHHDLVELPRPVRTDDFQGVHLAADVVRADPSSLLLR